MGAFMKNPALVWEWYAHRKTIIAGIRAERRPRRPRARWSRSSPDFAVITQNIDNLHRRAGSTRPSTNSTATSSGTTAWSAGRRAGTTIVLGGTGYPRLHALRRTRAPRRRLVRRDAPRRGMGVRRFVRPRGRTCSFPSAPPAVVYPAASLPLIAQRAGAYLVEINPEPTPLTARADEFLRGPSGAVLPDAARGDGPGSHTPLTRERE